MTGASLSQPEPWADGDTNWLDLGALGPGYLTGHSPAKTHRTADPAPAARHGMPKHTSAAFTSVAGMTLGEGYLGTSDTEPDAVRFDDASGAMGGGWDNPSAWAVGQAGVQAGGIFGIEPPLDPGTPPIFKGTTFFGGAGIDGAYINDMVAALTNAGFGNVRAADSAPDRPDVDPTQANKKPRRSGAVSRLDVLSKTG